MTHGGTRDAMTPLVRRRWRLVLAVAVAVGVAQAGPELLTPEPAASIALRFALWLVETPIQILALSLVYDHAVARGVPVLRRLVECVVVAIGVGAISGAAFVQVVEGLLGLALDEKGPIAVEHAAGYGAMMGAVLTAIWGFVFVSPYETERAQRRALETDQLRLEAERLRVAAEMAQLRSQLEPHFLLNTLNTIAGLVTQNPREARRLIGCLGDLLRDAAEGHDEMASLAGEITWLRRYTEILESRHGDALRFEWEIAAGTGDLRLPRLLLQPLVENAVQHGALRRAEGGRVRVKIAIEGQDPDARLVCSVEDNGPGLSADAPRADAVGVRSVRRRLELRCPGSSLDYTSSNEGTSAVIVVPLGRTAA